MANRSEILKEINQLKHEGQDEIRRNYLRKLSDFTGNTTIIYFSAFPSKIAGIPGGLLTIGLDDIQGFMTCINGTASKSLDLVLHSPGGSLEAADQIVQYLRSKFDYIRAIIPQNAMSAATMIACACDEIILGRESAIGPIDPQISLPMANGISIPMPAHSILEDFKKAKEDVITNAATAALWAPKLATLPAGMLDFCEKTINNAKTKVGEWLNAYMFKDEPVKKGNEIAQWLGDFNIHKTHGRPINYDLAKSQGLNVKRLEDNPELQDLVLSVYHATLVTFDVTQCVKIIENHLGKGAYMIVQTQHQAQIILPQPVPQPTMPAPPPVLPQRPGIQPSRNPAVAPTPPQV